MTFPIENPVIVLALCLFIMLVVPSACRRIGMPSIFGLILSGIIIGPKGFNLIGEGSGLELLSTAGLMYLMFMMTLEIDMFGFRKNKFKSMWFGVSTFVIPFILGFVFSYWVFSFNITASLLLSCMFSTHTLVSYPIASRLNITKTEPVVVSIGGTIITDMAVLMFLAIIITYYEGALSVFFWVKTIVLLGALMFTMFWCFPRICRWYFSHFQSDDTAQYIFVLTSLFLSGFLAELAGIESIVGAFMCGLVLNRTIPHQSTLMTRTIFIGNSVFVPFFLIYIGMLVDVRAFLKGFDTLIFSAALIGVAMLSKYIAAFVMQLLYRYTRAERLLFFGLSCSHAAATIAVVLVGYRMGIFNEQIINGTVLIILFTCLISTYLTDYAGRLVALQQKTHDVKQHKSNHVLVPISNPETALTLFDFAVRISQSNNNSSVLPLTIATSPQQMEQSILKDKAFVDYFTNQANAAKVHYTPATRIDSNISEGIIHAAMETQSTHIVLGWSGQSGTAKYFFGTIIEKLLEHCPQTLMVVNMKTRIVVFRKIYVLIPRNAAHEAGFKAWMLLIHTLQRNILGEVLFIVDSDTAESITSMDDAFSSSGKPVRLLTETPNMQVIAGELRENDLLVVVLARPNSVSYSRKLAVMPRVITRYFSHTNSMILYPEQIEVLHYKSDVNFGII